jgi:hypothetical protein
MHKITITLFLFISFVSHSQIKGKVTSKDGQSIPFVSISIENTYTGTSANEEGLYELSLKSTGHYTIIFQSLGYKTKKEAVDITSFPYTLNIVMEDESYVMAEMVLSNKEDPANAIIRQAIAAKKQTLKKLAALRPTFILKGYSG